MAARGDDTLCGPGGNDRLDGGEGIDTVSYAGVATGVLSISASPRPHTPAGSAAHGIENIVGSAFADRLIGNAGANALSGGGGTTCLLAASGATR